MGTKFQLIFATIGGTIGYLIGGYDKLLMVFLSILLLDTATGMFKAWVGGEYSSSKCRKGFMKKTAYLFTVFLAVQLDILLGNTGTIRGACLVLFSVNEACSIVENVGQMGVSVPDVLKNALEVLKKKSNNLENK